MSQKTDNTNTPHIAKIISGVILGVILFAGLYVVGIYFDIYGKTRDAGVIQAGSLAPEILSQRVDAQQATIEQMDENNEAQILFGDLHVHSTFSTDAFLWSMPIYGGEGVYPIADACDYARYCSGIDFWAITDHAEATTKKRWSQTKQSLRDCNARAGDPSNPDMISYLGFEWSQVGPTPETHYGHKNVIFEGLEDKELAMRPIASGGLATEVLRNQSSNMMPRSTVFLDFENRQVYYDIRKYLSEIGEAPSCDPSLPSNELPDDCFEIAETPADLVERLGQQNLNPLIIPHGSSWGFYTPFRTTWDKQLKAAMYPEKFKLIEIMSGHGNSEEYRDYENAIPGPDVMLACPEPTENFTPLCHRAGEILLERCLASGETQDVCEDRAEYARFASVNMITAGHLSIGASEPSDWLDAGQCIDCFRPSFNHRPGTSIQYGLAISNFDDPENPARFNWGFISASDNHRARPGTGYKPAQRLRTTEMARIESDYLIDMMRQTNEEYAEAELMTLDDRRDDLSFNMLEVERQGSYWTTGGLAAVHTPSRDRKTVFNAMENRQVYATSGPRILLWFDLKTDKETINMGGSTNMDANPTFTVKAVGDFDQLPGCPTHVIENLGAKRVQKLCGGECYNPSDERLPITRIEIVRIKPQISPDEKVGNLIEDPWLVHQCDTSSEGCQFSFTDEDFVKDGRDTTYYARAIQRTTQVINADPLRCEYDETGQCVKVNLCYGDYRQDPDDQCDDPSEERAWSSPIYVNIK